LDKQSVRLIVCLPCLICVATNKSESFPESLTSWVHISEFVFAELHALKYPCVKRPPVFSFQLTVSFDTLLALAKSKQQTNKQTAATTTSTTAKFTRPH